MKRLQKFLAMMLTAVMCVGTLADTGLTVFAADAEDEAVAEDAADEEETSEETGVPANEQADEDEDPVTDEPADDGAVTKLVVNGTNMLLTTKAGHFLKPNGEQYSGSIADAMQKPYMYYDKSEGRLQLHDITLDGKYGFMSNGICDTGIEFAGDKLIVEVIGKCRIAQDGVALGDAYGIDADGDIIIRNTVLNRKAVPGSLGILPASNAEWISSIKCSGNLTVEGVHGSGDTDDNAPLKLDTDASDVSRYVDGSEIDCAGDLTVKDALISVKVAGHGVNTKAINCGGNISIESGTVEAESDGDGTDGGRYAIKAEGDISIGEKAEVSAIGCGKSGFGIFSSAGKVIINGTVYATGKFDPIYANSEIVLGEGTVIATPVEGKLSGNHKQIVAWDGTKVTDVQIEKGHYLDIWVSGQRLGTWDKDIRALFTPVELNGSYYDQQTNTLVLDNVDGIRYFDNGSPTVPSDKPAIYTKVPLTIKGNNTKIEYDGKIISTSGADINIQGDLNLKSADGIAVYAGGASITVDGEETVLKAQSDKKDAIEVGFSGAIVINNGKVEAKAAASDSAGIYCDGDITINGGDVTAEGGKHAIEAFGENKKITLADGITIAEPMGGKVKSIQEGKKKLTTIVDSSDNAAKKVKLTNGKYDLWVGGVQVTDQNKGDILGDGKVKFDPEKTLLELNNVTAINGKVKVEGVSREALIYSKFPITIKGSANLESDCVAIAITGEDTWSSIEGNYTFKTKDTAIFSTARLDIIGKDTVIKAECMDDSCIRSNFLSVQNSKLDLTCEGNIAIIVKGACQFAYCDLTAKGYSRAILVESAKDNSIDLVEGTEIVEPEGGTIKQESGNTFIVKADGSYADKVHIAKTKIIAKGSPFNPIPERLEEVTDLILVKGQKFNMPTNGWSVEKDSKKYVSVSKKGKVSAKKETPEGTVAKITDGNRTIEIKIIKPHFEKKTIKLEAKGAYEAASCGFIVGDDSVPVAYYSSAYDVAQISTDGKIYAKTYGTATITAFVNGKAYTTKVKVTEPTPLKDRKIHINVNVKKKISIKGVKIKEWSTSEFEAQYVTIKNSTVKASMTGEYVLIGKDKDGNEYVVRLVVEDPEIAEPVFTEDLHKPGSNKYKLVLGVGEVTKLKFKSMDQPVIFRSGKGTVAYADEKLNITPQTSGKCKLTAKINGKTVTISVKVD